MIIGQLFRKLTSRFFTKINYSDFSALSKDKALSVLAINGLKLEFMSSAIKDDEQCVRVAVRQNAKSFLHASPRLRSNPDFVLYCVLSKLHILAYADASVFQNSDILEQGLVLNKAIYNVLPLSLQRDRTIALQAVNTEHRDTLKNIASHFPSDIELAYHIVRIDGHLLKYFDKTPRSNKTVVLAAVRNKASALSYVDVSLLGDMELGKLAAFSDKPWKIRELSMELQKSHEFILELINHDPTLIAYCLDQWKDDDKTMLKVIKNDASNLFYASPRLKLLGPASHQRFHTTFEYWINNYSSPEKRKLCMPYVGHDAKLSLEQYMHAELTDEQVVNAVAELKFPLETAIERVNDKAHQQSLMTAVLSS